MFAKYWEAGRVKTRLAKSVGEVAARDVYLCFLQHLVRKYSKFGDRRTLVFSPFESKDDFSSWCKGLFAKDSVRKPWGLHPQAEGDLGTRMRIFFETFGKSEDDKNILIGSDSPDVPANILEHAVSMLDNVPVVFGPSTDGGYYLIAMRGKPQNVFEDIPWSTPEVMPSTQRVMQQQGIAWGTLPEWTDVDELSDLNSLMKRLNAATDGADAELHERLKAMELPDVC